MAEIILSWPMDLPQEWMPVIRQHAEKYARSKIQEMLSQEELGGLIIEVIGSSPSAMNLHVQGPPLVLRRIKRAFTS
jgi:hypothetical protein